MKIALFTDTFDEINGVANTYRLLVDYAARKKILLDIYTYGEKDSIEVRATVRVLRFRHVLPFKYYSDLSFDLAVIRPKIIKTARTARYDLIHTATPGSMGMNALAAAVLTGTPLIGAYHTDLPKYFAPRVERFFAPLLGRRAVRLQRASESVAWMYMKAYYNRCAKVLAPSRHTLCELSSRLKTETGIFSRGVDAATFNPSHREGSNGVPACLYVGRVSVEKRLDLLQKIFRRRDNATLTIVGDGPYRRKLQRELPQAVFTGAVHDVNVLKKLYASADIFVFPSETETFGQVLMEAAAAGLPRIVSDKGASKELVRHGVDGFVAKDETEFAGCLERLIASPRARARMGLSARQFALTRSWDEVFGALSREWEFHIKHKECRANE